MLRGSNIYITEDFSKKVKDRRTELQRFMKKIKSRHPGRKLILRYDKLIVDKDVYVFNESTGQVSGAQKPTVLNPLVPNRYCTYVLILVCKV